MKSSMRGLALGTLLVAAVALPASAKAAEKNWSVEAGVDYSTLYMFRGINLLGDNQEVLTPRLVVGVGNFSFYYYGYTGNFDQFDEFGSQIKDGKYGESDFGGDYTFPVGSKLSVTVGYVTYQYDSETETGLGFADTYELYGIAAWDVFLSPTISFYRDMDAVEGGFLTLDLSHEVALTESIGLNFMGQVGFDFGYNQPGDPSAGIDKSQGDLNHVMLGVDLPITLTDKFSAHVLVQRFISLKIADDVGQPDETVVTGGLTYTF